MFVCTPEKEAKKRVNKLGDLKQLVEHIEKEMLVPCSFACCPICLPPIIPVPEPEKEKCPIPNLPDVMVCYKTEKVERSRRGERSSKRVNRPKRLRKAKSRELRAGILYRGCDCEKHNGLQDDCRRTDCHGSPECLTKPDPICGPSEFSNGKHLGKRRYFTKESGGDGDEADEEGEARVTVFYNCYPAAVKC